MIKDFGLIWWDESEKLDDDYTLGVPGAFCYVGGGSRWSLADWPPNPGLFDRTQPCK